MVEKILGRFQVVKQLPDGSFLARSPDDPERLLQARVLGSQSEWRSEGKPLHVLADLALRVRSPGIARTVALEVGEDDRMAWEVTEAVLGGTLHDLVRAAPAARLPIAEAVGIIRDAARTLHGAASLTDSAGSPLVHRCLSPDSIQAGFRGAVLVSGLVTQQLANLLSQTRT